MSNRRTTFLSPDQEARLTAAYNRTGGLTVKDLAVEWGVNDSTLSYYARHHLKLKPLVPYRQRNEWSELEIEIMERYSTASDKMMARHLARLAGSRRSLMAISVKRSRLGMLQDSIEDQGYLSTELVAAGLGLHNKTINRWIEQGHIRAKRRRGQWWGVSYEDLRAFLLHPLNANKWSLKKADQPFLLDVLRGPTTAPVVEATTRTRGGVREYSVHHAVEI